MKISVGNLQIITAHLKAKRGPEPQGPRDERRIRFAVTLSDDDGTPLWTQEGWTLSPARKIMQPLSTGRFGQALRFTHSHPRFDELLAKAVLSIPGVEDALGPKVTTVVGDPVPAEPLPGQADVGELT